MLISKSTIYENKNNNKLKCGNIHFCNNIKASIINSNFFENSSKGNGGAMYVKKKLYNII